MALHSYELQDDVLFPVDPRLAGVQPVEVGGHSLFSATLVVARSPPRLLPVVCH